MFDAVRDCLGWVGLGWARPPDDGASTTATGSAGGHSQQSSCTSQDLFEEGIGRFDPNNHKGARVPIFFPDHGAQTWVLPGSPGSSRSS